MARPWRRRVQMRARPLNYVSRYTGRKADVCLREQTKLSREEFMKLL
jgi:hypothetical protein